MPASMRLKILLTALTGIGLVYGVAAQVLGLSPAAALAGFALAYAAGGWPPVRGAIVHLVRERRIDIDLLMALAALAAAAVGEFRDGAILLFLFSLAETLESYAMGRARREIEALMALRPETAHRLAADGSVEDVPVATLAPGDMVMVRPGERIPVDGLVATGRSRIDESTVTGESAPALKSVGASVFEATVNGQGVLQVEVQRPSSESTVARMIALVTQAQAQKAPSERFSAWFGQRYTIAVLAGSTLALAVLVAIGREWDDALYRAATLLVAASPCAIVISVPAAILSALSASARGGVLFKGGAALETFGAVRQFAFDKTGTLTSGRAEVLDIRAFGRTEEEALALFSGIEAHSEHHVADALRRFARERGVAPMAVEDAQNVPGEGITARNGEAGPLWAGAERMAERMGADLDGPEGRAVAALAASGDSVVILGRGETILAAALIADAPRPTARAALAALRAAGIERITMLTGDRPEVAARLAPAFGLDPADVHASQLPEDKVVRIRVMQKAGPVAFVGDGVNDAGALATADVGVAMGAAGSEVALQAADVALLSGDLRRLEKAHALAKRTNRIIRQNLAFAVGAMIVLVILTLFFDLSLPLAVIGHEGGTLVVVANGLRLLFDPIRLPEPEAGRSDYAPVPSSGSASSSGETPSGKGISNTLSVIETRQ
ncbi:MAG: heavy metal translocating P-type ATPase [Salinarimonadaceae bacterium]|nr:MAG: heavy metal translocating P-type ATPase [Salinarimonadaceae bacterium]